VPPIFTPLADAGLGLHRAGVLAAMEPFVARRLTATDPLWTAEVARKSAKTRRPLPGRLSQAFHRVVSDASNGAVSGARTLRR
jgi:hypothetical protein